MGIRYAAPNQKLPSRFSTSTYAQRYACWRNAVTVMEMPRCRPQLRKPTKATFARPLSENSNVHTYLPASGTGGKYGISHSNAAPFTDGINVLL